MNDRPSLSTSGAPSADDDWLDAALRAEGRDHRAAYIDDAGFTARVMSGLPAPATLPAWRRPMLTGLWAAAGLGIALALPGTAFDIAHDVLRVILGQTMSLAGIATGVTALGLATWAAAAVALRDD
jgi:hypothetical protein